MKRAWLLLTFAVAGAVAPAAAHPGHSRSSRAVKVELTPDAARVSYALIFDRAASDAARRLADHDGNGRVTAAERDARLARMTEDLRSRLDVCRGANLESLACVTVAKDAIRPDAVAGFEAGPGKPLAIAWEIALELAPEDRALRLEDRSIDADVDRTDVLVEAAEGLTLALAGPGEGGAPSGITPEFKWAEDRPGEARQVLVTWEPPTPRWLVLSVVGIVALAMAGQLAWRVRAS